MADGTKTTVDEAIAQAVKSGALDVSAEQGDLFAADAVEPATSDELALEAMNRRRGRPKGAKNKKSAQLREYINQKYGNVACLLMARATASVSDMAATLGVDVMDIWKEQNRILESLLPYVMEKMTADQFQQNFIGLSVSGVKFDDEVKTIETADFRQISAGQVDDD